MRQQNQLEFLEMKICAESYLNSPDNCPWLNELLKLNNQSLNTGLLISASDIPEEGGMQWMGTWLTKDKKFFEFDIMAESASNLLIEVDERIEVFPELNEHCKGTRKSTAYIALELLEESEQI